MIERDVLKILPPDPDGMNDQRAAWAQNALNGFSVETHNDDCDMLADLLCDLMHWADRHASLSFAAELARAYSFYAAETKVTKVWR